MSLSLFFFFSPLPGWLGSCCGADAEILQRGVGVVGWLGEQAMGLEGGEEWRGGIGEELKGMICSGRGVLCCVME